MNEIDEADPGRAGAPSWDGFAPLYDASAKRLYHLALLLCTGHRAAAEDAVAQAFVRCYEAWTDGGVPDVHAYARQALVSDMSNASVGAGCRSRCRSLAGTRGCTTSSGSPA